MISNASIEEYARLAHLFRKALDESYAESKLKNYPIFSLFPQGTCGDCSCLLSRFIVEHNLPEPTYIAGERADGSTHAWLEIHDTIIDITHDQFGTLPAVYISNYDIPNTYLGFKIKNRNFVANGEYDYYNAYLEEVYQSWQRYSEPLITLTGFGDITLMVGTTIVELTGITSGIVLDCALKEAYLGTALMNDHMSGDFPVLKPGLNGISRSGNVTSVVISPRWRFL